MIDEVVTRTSGETTAVELGTVDRERVKAVQSVVEAILEEPISFDDLVGLIID